MTIKKLMQKELSNLYAINKQINHYFNGSEISFLSEKNQLNLMEYIKLVCQDEEQISGVLDQMDVNPTNTIDSIVQEITKNLGYIADQEMKDDVKEVSYLMSLNRLVSYHLANVENIQSLQAKKDMSVPVIGDAATLVTIKKTFLPGNA